MRSLDAPSFPRGGPSVSSAGPPVRPASSAALVRDVLVHRDRTRLADAVLHLLAPSSLGGGPSRPGREGPGDPSRTGSPADDLRADQLRRARGVLIDIEHVLRSTRSLDPRGVRRVSALLDDLREGRVPDDDPLALEDRAHEARRLLIPLTVG